MSDEFPTEKRTYPNSDLDQQWADYLAPTRRNLLLASGAAAAAGDVLAASPVQAAPAEASGIARKTFRLLNGDLAPAVFAPNRAVSEWGNETLKQATTRPAGLWPGTESGLPSKPQAYTDIKSYHAHFYFDADNYEKAALIRRWVGERFPVELGDWNLTPRGPHVTPSFYFGFSNDLLPVAIPWLQLNSLGLTILVHPNTTDPRADHLYRTLWVNRSQPVNAYGLKAPRDKDGNVQVEQTVPNVIPTIKLEV
jgi:aromatic ring-cleaving dioxygenase